MRPAALEQVTRYAATPHLRMAQRWAAATFRQAERDRQQAEALWKQGDAASAALWAERALATFERALLQARQAVAATELEKAKAELAPSAQQLQQLQEEKRQLEADLRVIEMRKKVIHDALPLVVPAAASGAREVARRESARALVAEAEQLCAAAQLVGASASDLEPLQRQNLELATLLVATGRPAPIDSAMRQRSACLALLTAARRPRRSAASSDEADLVLAELSRLGSFAPVRDERGVAVTLHDAFADAELTPAAAQHVRDLIGAMTSHAALPLLVVLHTSDPLDAKRRPRQEQRAHAVRRAFGRQDPTLEVMLAGASKPLVDAKDQGARSRNERLEIVWIDTGK